MRANYHTHTVRCMHATGSDEEYVLAAIEGGYDILGFSDHTPWPYRSGFVANMRMDESSLEDYVNSIRVLKVKYKDKIEIKIGLECEYFSLYLPWLKETIKKYELDYVILGNHFYKSDESGIYFGTECLDKTMLDIYVDEAIEAMKTGIYAYLAHPELFMRGYPSFDKDVEEISYRLCRAAKEYDMPLEYNLNGKNIDMRLGARERYPHHRFWEIAAEIGCKAIVGVDCHYYEELSEPSLFDESKQYLRSLGLNVLDKLDL